MKKTFIIFVLFVVALSIAGCASRPVSRPAVASIPILEKGWARLFIAAGKYNGKFKLWSDNQVGPVFINNEAVGSTAKDEHFVVDVKPGKYEIFCTTNNPDPKMYIEKRDFVLREGDVRYFACDIDPKGIGMHFGLLGVLASKYLAVMHLRESYLDPSISTLIGYKVFADHGSAAD